MWKQWRANEFPMTEGRIVSHDTSMRKSKGKASLLADREVSIPGSRQGFWKCTRIRYHDTESTPDVAKTLMAAYPIGSVATVHYDPADPSDAILDPGVRPSDFFVLLFLTPFLSITGIMWYAILHTLFLHSAVVREPLYPMKVEDRFGDICVLLPHFAPWAAGLLTGCILCWFMAIVIALILRVPVSDGATFAAWGVVFLGFAAAFHRQRRRIADGRFDLVLSPSSGDLRLPPWRSRKSAITIPRSAIRGINVSENRSQVPGSRRRNAPTYAVDIAIHAEEGIRVERIVEFTSDRESADRLAQWLEKNLGLSDKP
ncbi:MAG: DUF3592 domain-containing protein [Planctomycetota bacterium]